MPTLDVRAYLADTELVLSGIASKRYPKGHSYTVASLSWTDTLRLRRILPALTDGALTGVVAEEEVEFTLGLLLRDAKSKEVTLAEKLLGESYQEMVNHGVEAARMDRIVSILVMRHGRGEDAAIDLVAVFAAAEQIHNESKAAQAAKKAAPAKKAPAKAAAKKTPARKAQAKPST